jgi:hypothetical protein
MQSRKAKPWSVWRGLCLAIAVAAIAVSPAGEAHPAVLYLAKAVEGEGAGLFENREEVGTWIAHTALNRLEGPWWPDTIEEVVREGFHGHVRVSRPSDWAMEVAREAMARKGDLARGAVFVLSGEDLRAHGWRAEGAMRCFEEGAHALCFFREWPGDEESLSSPEMVKRRPAER